MDSDFRFQQPTTSAWTVRVDAVHARREGGEDLAGNPIERDNAYGARLEIRRQF